jgi:hypothetical protein
VLEALVERAERGPATAAALDHLSTCLRCERELTELALTVAALRRVGGELRRSPVPAPAPVRVAALAVPRRRSWAWRMQLGSLVTGAAIAALVVLPRTVGPTVSYGETVEAVHPAVVVPWRAAENRIAAAPDAPPIAAPTSVPPRYPEGLLRPWKEVFPSDAIPPELAPR